MKLIGFAPCRGLPASYLVREPDAALWQERCGADFPLADQTLRIFCRVFDFPEQDRFRFRPDDKVMDIYGHLYPSCFSPDSLEANRLIEDLESAFAVTLDNTDNRLQRIESFLEIVAEIKAAQHTTGT
jgi:hypothetical protein